MMRHGPTTLLVLIDLDLSTLSQKICHIQLRILKEIFR